VRAEHALALAVRLLEGDPQWPEDRLRAAIETGEYRQVRLAKPMPLLFVYLTGWVDPEGAVQFRPDLYRKDEGPLPAAGPEPCGTAAPSGPAG
jgi:murein L,D-transpeptidase YcbB/YkuD